MQLNTIKNKVEYVLQNSYLARENDKCLWLRYMKIHHDLQGILGDKYLPFVHLFMNKATPMPESIRRVRQKFQEHGQYCASKDVQEIRAEKQKEVRDWARS